MKGYNIQFQIYAENEQEAKEARDAIVRFISDLACCGRAVTGKKISEGLPKWKENLFIRKKVLDFFRPNKF